MNKIFLIISCAFVFLVGCEEISNASKLKSEATAVHQTKKSSKNVNVTELPLKKVTVNPVNLETIRLEVDTASCGKPEMMIAPSYVTDAFFYFDYYDSEKGVSWIKEMSRVSGTCEKIFEGKGIGNLTGFQDNLYFSSYDITNNSNVDWTIMGLNLESRKVSLIRNNKSLNNTEPPTIQATNMGINWIEYESTDKKVTSNLYEMWGKTKEIKLVESGVLNENGSRDGEYFAMQQSGEFNETLLYKSVFKDGNKEMDITSYLDGTKGRSLLKEDGILGFASSKKHFAYTGTGFFKSQSLEGNQLPWTYKADPQLTFDAPVFITDELVIFRYAMNQLFLANLNKGEVYPITDFEQLLSKPVLYNSFVSYATVAKDKKLYFTVIKSSN